MPGAPARVRPGAQRLGGGNRGESTGIERVDADLAARELQHRNLELAGPFPRLGEHAARDPVARCRGHAAVRLARRAEAQAVRRDAVDDELFLRERHHVEIGDELVRLQEILEGLVGTRDREAAHEHLAVRDVEMEVLDLDPRAQHLRADLLRLVPGDGVGEQPPEHAADDEQHEQRPDRAPAEDPEAFAHGRNSL